MEENGGGGIKCNEEIRNVKELKRHYVISEMEQESEKFVNTEIRFARVVSVNKTN